MDKQEMLDRTYEITARPVPGRPNTYGVVFIHSSEGYGARGSVDEPAPNATKVEVNALSNKMEARIVRRHPKDSGISDEAFIERAKKEVREKFHPELC